MSGDSAQADEDPNSIEVRRGLRARAWGASLSHGITSLGWIAVLISCFVCMCVVVAQSVSREVLGLVCGQRLCRGGLREVLGEEGALGIDWVDGGSTNYWYIKKKGTYTFSI